MKPGIYTIPKAEYHADPCVVPSLSCSLSKVLLNRSPAHAWIEHPRLNPLFEEKQSGSFDVGSAAHSVLLEGLNIIQVCDYKDWRKDAAKVERDEAYKAGKVPLLPEQNKTVLDMVKVSQLALERCQDLGGVDLSMGKAEQTVIWNEPYAACRSRLDWIQDDHSLVIDYKSTDIATPGAWMRSISANGYDVQEAFYKRGVKAVTGKTPHFVFMVQETSAPYAVYFVALPPEYQAIGELKVKTAINVWSECMRTGIWPSYSSRIMYPDPPAWVMADAEELAAEAESPDALARFDLEAPGNKERFLFGKVPEKKS